MCVLVLFLQMKKIPKAMDTLTRFYSLATLCAMQSPDRNFEFQMRRHIYIKTARIDFLLWRLCRAGSNNKKPRSTKDI